LYSKGINQHEFQIIYVKLVTANLTKAFKKNWRKLIQAYKERQATIFTAINKEQF
jgi:hypothetical protein